MSRRKINIKLLPVKAHYFLFNAAAASLWPFVPLIGKQMGISAEAVGVIYAIAPVLGCLSKPFFGLVADRLKKRKVMFIFFIVLALTSSFCIAFLPQAQPERPVVFECGALGSNYIKQCGRKSHCTEISVLDSIKMDSNNKKPGSSPHGSSYNSTVNNKNRFGTSNSGEQWSSSESHIIEETCDIRCEIHTFIDGKIFCDNLRVIDSNGVPEICQNRNSRNSPSVQQIQKSASPSPKAKTILEPEAYVLQFDAVLKLSSAILLEEPPYCLYLPIETVSFTPGNPGSFHQFSCQPETSYLSKCFADCPNNKALNKRLERVLEDPDVLESSSFWLYGILVIIAFASLAVSTSISDALCFQTLGPKPRLYGMQRQWGAVGWGIFTLVAGYFVDTNSQGKLLKDYTACFYLLLVLYIMDLMAVYKWEVEEVEKPKQIRKDMWNLMTDLRIIVFIFACIIVGMCTGMHWQFLFWYVEDMAGTDCDMMKWMKVLQGLMVAVQCFSELPFFYFAGWFIKRLGYENCLSIVLGAFGIRFLIYSVITHPWAFIPVELFQGITYGIFYSVMTSYASVISPKGAGSTVQGLVGAAFEGLGVAAGSLVGGIILNEWKGQIAYRLFGFGALIFCALYTLTMCCLNRTRNYGVPIGKLTLQEIESKVISDRNFDTTDTTDEPEGQEMYKMNGVSQDLEMDSDIDIENT